MPVFIFTIIIQVFRKGPTDDINGNFGAAEQNFSFNFSKAKTRFHLSLH